MTSVSFPHKGEMVTMDILIIAEFRVFRLCHHCRLIGGIKAIQSKKKAGNTQ
jgi:hypothetical protein